MNKKKMYVQPQVAAVKLEGCRLLEGSQPDPTKPTRATSTERFTVMPTSSADGESTPSAQSLSESDWN